jgi:hypothetical protein
MIINILSKGYCTDVKASSAGLVCIHVKGICEIPFFFWKAILFFLVSGFHALFSSVAVKNALNFSFSHAKTHMTRVKNEFLKMTFNPINQQETFAVSFPICNIHIICLSFPQRFFFSFPILTQNHNNPKPLFEFKEQVERKKMKILNQLEFLLLLFFPLLPKSFLYGI